MFNAHGERWGLYCVIQWFALLGFGRLNNQANKTFTTTLLHRDNKLLLRQISETKSPPKSQTEISQEHIIYCCLLGSHQYVRAQCTVGFIRWRWKPVSATSFRAQWFTWDYLSSWSLWGREHTRWFLNAVPVCCPSPTWMSVCIQSLGKRINQFISAKSCLDH